MNRHVALCLFLLVFISASAVAQFKTEDLPVDLAIPRPINWTIDLDVYRPIHIRIDNNTDKTIKLNYDWFKLLDPAGNELKIESFRRVEQRLKIQGVPEYYMPHKGRSLRDQILREKSIKPGKFYWAVAYFKKPDESLSGNYKLIVEIPQNEEAIEYSFNVQFKNTSTFVPRR